MLLLFTPSLPTDLPADPSAGRATHRRPPTTTKIFDLTYFWLIIRIKYVLNTYSRPYLIRIIEINTYYIIYVYAFYVCRVGYQLLYRPLVHARMG
eukprot:sb/3479240/